MTTCIGLLCMVGCGRREGPRMMWTICDALLLTTLSYIDYVWCFINLCFMLRENIFIIISCSVLFFLLLYLCDNSMIARSSCLSLFHVQFCPPLHVRDSEALGRRVSGRVDRGENQLQLGFTTPYIGWLSSYICGARGRTILEVVDLMPLKIDFWR